MSGLSRRLGRGDGAVIGGRVGLALDPTLLSGLAAGRRVALVSGTNGKTTTTAMLAAALTEEGATVATNATGANMPPGHVSALLRAPGAATVVLEVDEGYLGRVVEATRPQVVVLLNLSRDQLDRIAEVRLLVDRWRLALGALPATGAIDSAADRDVDPDADGNGTARTAGTVVVANADDPMVVWAASTAPAVRWVGAGQVWREDAVGCPSCGGRIVFEADGGWHCDACDFARPERCAWLEGHDLVLADGRRLPVDLALPGGFNRANAAMVALAAPELRPRTGHRPVDVATALRRLAGVGDVAGRFATVVRRGRPVRLLLAKNPAGWTAIFDLLDESGSPDAPVVLSVNARVADGFDPSWLWDVPFERLAGRPVVATGERCRDLAVRLRYAEVDHEVVPDPVAAVDAAVGRPVGGDAAGGPAGPTVSTVEFLGNYTAFADLRSRL